MLLRKAEFKTSKGQDWFIWSINPEDGTVSCLPYNHTDEQSFFVYDLKEFPIQDVLNADAISDSFL